VPSGASIASGQGSTAITVNYACGAISGNVGVTPTSSCGNGTASSTAVTVGAPLAANAGSGQTVCAGNPATIGGSPTASGGAGGYAYSWSPGGATVANPSVSPTTTTLYTVTVTDANGCTASSQVTVTANPLPTTSAISGSATVNANQAGVTYSVTATAGSSYAWTVPSDATVTAGQGSSSITVTFGTTSGNVAVTETSPAGCVGAPVSLAVTVQAVLEAPVIASEAIVGGNFQITFTGPTGQTWKVMTSTDVTLAMTNWTMLSNGTFTASPETVTDASGASQPGLFYRVISP
jgi:hypothetical protein